MVSVQFDSSDSRFELVLPQVAQECDSRHAASCQHKRDRQLCSDFNGGPRWIRNLDGLERAGLLGDGDRYRHLDQGQPWIQINRYQSRGMKRVGCCP